MKIAVAFKVLPDDQDIVVAPNGSLDLSKAKPTISSYDLNAIEAAVQLAAACGAEAVNGITVGGKSADDSKTKKNALARGLNELSIIAEDATANLDAYATAAQLAKIVQSDTYELVVCGDGSADNFSQQVDVQLACALGWPVVTSVVELSVADNRLTAKRMLEDVTETVEVNLPCVVSVTPEIAEPRIPGMKDILAAGKKPVSVTAADGVSANTIEVIDIKAPESADRKLVVLDAKADGAIEEFAAALKAAL